MSSSDLLPAAAWTGRDGLRALAATMGAGKLRWVGGAVRDTLLGHPVSDVDAATPLPPQSPAALPAVMRCPARDGSRWRVMAATSLSASRTDTSRCRCVASLRSTSINSL